MDITLLTTWIRTNPLLALAAGLALFSLTYLVARLIFARGFIYITTRTRTKYDDIIAQKVKPYRAAWLVPFTLIYALSFLTPEHQALISRISLFFILWLLVATLNGLISAANQIYESTSAYHGVSIQGYLDVLRILLILVGVILSISLLTGKSPLILLSGLGALTAVLMLAFHDTLMSLIASVQITFQNLIREGDWLEVPAYDADGAVINVGLHIIRIQNWDMTITAIPTYKLLETSYKNWRGMQESGGRRIMRSVYLDQNSISFCTPAMVARYGKIDLVEAFIADRRKQVGEYKRTHKKLDSDLDGPQITNVEVFRAYMEAYLRTHPAIHTSKMDFLVRELAPSPNGLPVQVYVFSKATEWVRYEQVQAEIFDHLLAAAAYFDLRVFQQPSGGDFTRVLRTAR